MKIEVSKADLLAAIRPVAAVINTSSEIPMCAQVLISTAGDEIVLRATDLDLNAARTCKAFVIDEGSTNVNGRIFAKFLARVDADHLTLEATDAKLTVRAGEAVTDFPSLISDDFPMRRDGKVHWHATFPFGAFIEVGKMAASMASDEPKRGAVLQSVLVEIGENVVTMLGTDGYKMSRTRTLAPKCDRVKMLILGPFFDYVAKNFPKAHRLEVATFGSEEAATFVRFTAGGMQASIRLTEGDYPDASSFVGQKKPSTVIAERETLLRALERVRIFSSDRANFTNFDIEDNVLTLTADSDLVGRTTEKVVVEQEGPEVSIAFNAVYFIELLKAVSSKTVLLEFADAFSPVSIKPIGTIDQELVLMPLRK